jgi:hypothetical protein
VTQAHGLGHNSRVRATETVREVEAGDTGTVTAAWRRAKVYVVWDKDGLGRAVHHKRLELLPAPADPA